MAHGFGAEAYDWTSRFPTTVDLVTADLNQLGVALAFVGDLKRQARPIAGSIFLPDLKAKIATTFAAQIAAQFRDPDERIEMFANLDSGMLNHNGVPQKDWIKYDDNALVAARDFLAACDIWVTRSAVEACRLLQVIGGSVHDTIVRAAPFDPLVPAARTAGAKRDSVVVWGARDVLAQCAVIVQGLESLRIPIIVVCAQPERTPPGTNVQVVGVERASSALARALVIVDASLYDPGTARALATHKIPLATAWTSGAHEWLRGVYPYSPADSRSVFNATMGALSGAGPRLIPSDDGVGDLARELQHASDSLITDGPLVTVIVPTYNRQEMLPNVLRSIENQRYQNIEIIVVNDGGNDVAPIVAQFPRARLETNERNFGVTYTINAGIAAAQGEYVAFIADDDSMFHDHISRLVGVLERSGCSVAHSNDLVQHYDVEDDALVLRGHHIGSPRPSLPSNILLNNEISGPGLLFRRHVFTEHGSFDDLFGHGCDFDMWMRLSKHYDFAFVNRVTVQVSMRNDGSQLSSTTGEVSARLLERIYARHPVNGRPMLERKRNEFVEHIRGLPALRAYPAQPLSRNDLTELHKLNGNRTVGTLPNTIQCLCVESV